jgi:hypothetical protein
MASRSKFQAPRVLNSFEQVQVALRQVQESLDAATGSRAILKVNTRDFTLVTGNFQRCSAPPAGISARLPAATGENLSDPIIIHLENMMGDLTIYAAPGQTVNGEATATFNVDGVVILWSNGADSWSGVAQVPAESPAGEALDAQYVLGAAHLSLPNGAVGNNTTSVNVTITPGGFATWDLNALTGAVQTTAGQVATRFAGIRTNSTLQTPRTRLHFINTNSVTWTPADDAGADEWQMRATVSLSNDYTWTGDHYFTGELGLVTEQTVAGSGPHDVTLPDGVTRLTFTGTAVTVNSVSGGTDTGRIVEVYFSGAGPHRVMNATAGGSGNESRIFLPNEENLDLTHRGSFVLQANGTAGWRTFGHSGDFVTNPNTITLTGSTGNLGTVDISTLSCGGNLTISAPAGDFQIEGFTAKPAGFFFFFTSSNSDVMATFFEEDTTATAANRIRSANGTDQKVQAPQGVFYYANTRWRCIMFQNSDEVQSFTTAGTTNDLALNAKTTCLRIDTGNSDWQISGFTGGYHGRKLIVMNASNSSSMGQFVHQTLSSAGNQLFLPGSVTRRGNRMCAIFEYDGTDSAWRHIADNGLSVIATNSVMANVTGGDDIPTPLTASVDTGLCIIGEGSGNTGLAFNPRDDMRRWLESSGQVTEWTDEFQGNLASITPPYTSLASIAGTSTVTITIDAGSVSQEYLGAINFAMSHSTVSSSSGWVLGAAETARNFNWGSFRYACFIVRPGTGATTTRTSFAIGLLSDFAGYAAAGSPGLLGSTTQGYFFSYDTGASSGAWVGGMRASSATSSTTTGVTATAGNRYVLELFKAANGNLYYYCNGSLFRTDATNTLTAGSANFYLHSRAETNTGIRNYGLDFIKIVSQPPNNRYT